jgi:hypothetical protein
MVPFLMILGLLTVVIVIGVFSARADARRTETLRTVTAPQLGLDFVHTDETGIQSGFDGFQLFSQGRSPLIRNIAYGRRDDVEVILFDYRYTTGSGKNKTTHHQTVGFFQSDGLVLPEFVARPENLFNKIGQVFGYQDIDLPMHPEFSRRYILRGVDESGIRDFFTADVARFFEANPGLSVEAKPDRFILYRPGKRLKPEQWKEWLDKGLAACEALRGR